MDDVSLMLVSSLARDWLKNIEKSSSTLMAAFHNSAYRTKGLREMVALVEKDLKVTPAPHERLEKRLIAISEAAVKQQIPLDERWTEILPTLHAIADATPDASRWKAAKALRTILRE